MDKQQAYKDKVKAEINEHAAKLAAFKTKLKSEAADVKSSSIEKIDALEQKLSQAKDRLTDIGEVAEESWESVKNRLEVARNDVSKSIKSLFADDENKQKKQ